MAVGSKFPETTAALLAVSFWKLRVMCWERVSGNHSRIAGGEFLEAAGIMVVVEAPGDVLTLCWKRDKKAKNKNKKRKKG